MKPQHLSWHKMARKSIYIGILVAAVLIGWYLRMDRQDNNKNRRMASAPEATLQKRDSQTGAVTIRGVTFQVEIPKTTEQKARGLSGRPSLPEGEGMLFLIDKPGVYPFWMKDMQFPIDIIWIAQGKIADITHNLPPPKTETEPPATAAPKSPADTVLEINSGLSEKYGFKVGDRVATMNAKF